MTDIDIGPEARAIIERLGNIDCANPRIDKPAVEAALQRHLSMLGLPSMPVRWVVDATD